MTDAEVDAIVQRKQRERYIRAVRASNRRVQYEQSYRDRLRQAERILRND